MFVSMQQGIFLGVTQHVNKEIKMEKKTITIIILAILLVGAFSYIGMNKLNESKQQEQLEIYQQGAMYGYEEAIIQVVQMAVTCEQVPLTIENRTINMIAVGCLNAN